MTSAGEGCCLERAEAHFTAGGLTGFLEIKTGRRRLIFDILDGFLIRNKSGKGTSKLGASAGFVRDGLASEE